MRWAETTKRIGAPLAKQSIFQSPTQTSPICPACRLFSISSPARRDERPYKKKIEDPLASKPKDAQTHGRSRRQTGTAKTSTLFTKLFPNVTSGSQTETSSPAGQPIVLKPIQNRTEKNPPRLNDRLRRAADGGKLWLEKRKERIDTNELRAWLESQAEQEEGGEGGLGKVPDVVKNTPAVLIMFNASKSLTESDFHRLVRQNPHLEGWNSQLEKVDQAYDRNTLEPLGSYFLHFNSVEAARKFQLQAQKLHNKPIKNNLDPYSTPSLRLEASPETPLRLKMYTIDPHTLARLRGYTLDGIIGKPEPAVGSEKKKTQTSPSQAPGESHRVVLSLQQGAVGLSTLQDLLRQDGVHRNLAWDVTDILPYHAGKVMAISGRMKKGLAWKSRTAVKPAPEDASQAPEEEVVGEAPQAGEPASAEAPLKSGRFVLSFGAEAEARRFTRMWHRREFHLPQGAAPDANPTITVNAMIPL